MTGRLELPVGQISVWLQVFLCTKCLSWSKSVSIKDSSFLFLLHHIKLTHFLLRCTAGVHTVPLRSTVCCWSALESVSHVEVTVGGVWKDADCCHSLSVSLFKPNALSAPSNQLCCHLCSVSLSLCPLFLTHSFFSSSFFLSFSFTSSVSSGGVWLHQPQETEEEEELQELRSYRPQVL